MEFLLLLEGAEIFAIERVDSSEHHGFGRFKSWFRVYLLSDSVEGVSNSCFFDLFHVADDVADLSRCDGAVRGDFGLQKANFEDLVGFS